MVQVLEELEVVDIKLALEMIGGYEQVYHKVIDCFLETNCNLIQDVTYQLDNNIDEARRLVHSCKGISENIGSRLFFEVSKNFELAIINQDKELINDLFTEFKVVFNTVVKDLKKIMF
ncbi:MAG: two-component system histidine kinase / response regulator [Haloplasmataceae bacterium]|jgi:HPt (histidine-containing phosphotransfer) domain-containing protein|nr:two-component system histidine kinase / response regulator [Haloplasmataceae bacterium]